MKRYALHVSLGHCALLALVLGACVGCPTPGSFKWAARAGGVEDDFGAGLAPMLDGGVVVVGQFTGRAVFGAGGDTETTLQARGSQDKNAFVARYAPDGALRWAVQAGGPEDDHAAAVAVAPGGIILVTGYFQDHAVFGEGQAGETTLWTSGRFDRDIFVARYRVNGELVWARRAGGGGFEDGGAAISAFADGSFVVAGNFEDRAVFGEADEPQVVLTARNARDTDIFVARYTSDGRLAWATSAGGLGPDRVAGVAATLGGGCVVTGTFEDRARFGVEEPNDTELAAAAVWDRDIFVASYDADGALVWARRAGGPGVDDGLAVAAFGDGSVVVTGGFEDTAVFGEYEDNETVLTADTQLDRDMFLARYARDGSLEWAVRAGGLDPDEGAAVYTTATGCVVTGRFETSITFDRGGPNETTLRTPAEFDTSLFLARYDRAGSLVRAEQMGAMSAGTGVSANIGGEVVVTGHMRGSVTVRNPAGVPITLRSAGGRDVVVAKLAF